MDAAGPEVAAAGHHTGIAWALSGLMHAVPFHAAARRLYLPQDLSQAAGLRRGELFELHSSPAPNPAPSPALCRVVEQVAARTREHLEAARAPGDQIPKKAGPALLCATLAEQGLARLARAGYDPFDTRVQEPPAGRALRLAWASLRGRY